MLFQKLYNWVKYKTLPPSLLFKNRLFIERDSKSRRVFTNFGLTFRNSKWSSYSTANVTFFFKNSYLTLILLFFLFAFIFKYTSSGYFYNVFFFFWLALDSFDYYLSFFIWVVSSFYALTAHSFFSFFVINKKRKDNTLNYPKDLINETRGVAKQDMNWFVYSWLTNDSTLISDINEDEVLEKIFDDSDYSLFWKNNYDFYINLYKSIFFLNINSKNLNFFEINHLFNSINLKFLINSFFIFNVNTSFVKNYFWLFTNYYFLNNNPNVFFQKKKLTLSFYSERFNWSLNNINFLDINSKNLNRPGLFYINFFNFESLFFLNKTNLANNLLKNNLQFYTNFVKWDRWLYKYSLLHRKSFKVLNKFSNIKKSLNFSLFNDNLYGKNLWMSSYFKENNNFILLFNDIISSPNSFSNSNLSIAEVFFKRSSFKNLSFYDDSYVWFLKRFYFLNNISSNFFFTKSQDFFKSSFVFKKETSLFLNKKTAFENYLCFFLKNKNFFLNDLNYSIYTEQTDFNLNLNFNLRHLDESRSFLTDKFVLNKECDVFNKDFLQNLICLTTNLDYNYLNAHISSLFFVKKKKKITFAPSRGYPLTNRSVLFNTSLLKSISDRDSFFNNDLIFLTKTFKISK